MQAFTLIFPHQLYAPNPAIEKGRDIYLIEDDLYFSQYLFHQKKLLLHRSSMQAYAEVLRKKGHRVEYCMSLKGANNLESLFKRLSKQACNALHIVDPVDYLLSRRLRRYAATYSIPLHFYASPNFINTLEVFQHFFNKKKKYLLNDFYIDQRKRTGILMKNGLPVGGKWTFDDENRKRLPTQFPLPEVKGFPIPKSLAHLPAQIKKSFPTHYGSVDGFNYPVTHLQARNAFEAFLQQRFVHYGTYQDAIHDGQSILFHSWITPALNIGLLAPQDIIRSVIEHAEAHSIALNQVEGFIRQVMGWREFIRGVYEQAGVRQRTANFWGFRNPLPTACWMGTTGIVPVDNVIKRLLETGYSNHIERLMILGNFMCLCEIDPDEVYRWFMTLYIDAYDWVMVPNVYGMSQFADGGLMSTKPYISGSNYILKMSRYPKGPWCAVWDGLFWRFLHRHRDFFAGNPRLSMLLGSWDKMEASRKKEHLKNADGFLNKFYQ